MRLLYWHLLCRLKGASEWKMCFSQTLLAGCRTGECLDRGLQTAGFLITATLGLCILLLVLDTVQAQGIKNPQFHYRLYLQVSRAPEKVYIWRYTHVQPQRVCVERAVLGFWPVCGCLTITDWRCCFGLYTFSRYTYVRIKDKANTDSVMQL